MWSRNVACPTGGGNEPVRAQLALAPDGAARHRRSNGSKHPPQQRIPAAPRGTCNVVFDVAPCACVQAGKGGIVANPNCSTIIALMAVTPLHRQKTVKRMVVSTYQAASGAGQAAMEELEAQTRAVLNNEPPPMNIFPHVYAFNLFSHNAPVGDNGYNEEVRFLFLLVSNAQCGCKTLLQSNAMFQVRSGS